MIDDKLATIATFESASEAYAARSWLESHGIAASVGGDASATALSYVGSALGGVKLYVRAADQQRAWQMLHGELNENAANSGPWQCRSCREEVDAGFDICWSCGATRDEAAIPLERVPLVAHVLPTLPDAHNDAESSLASVDLSNPYTAPQVAQMLAKSSDVYDELQIDEELEEMVMRAWRAAIIGLVFWPVVLHFYSMWLLIRVSLSPTELSPSGSRRFMLTMCVNIAVAAAVATLIVGIGRM